MMHVIVNPERVIRDHIKIEPTTRRQFPRFQKKFKALTHLEAMINGCIKLHRTTTLDFSTVTVEQEEYEEEEEGDDSPVSPSKNNHSPFRRGNPNQSRSLSTFKSKTSLKNFQNNETTTPVNENEKFFRKNRRDQTVSTIYNTINNPGTVIGGPANPGAFESYINNMENDRGGSSPMLSMSKKKLPSQILLPKTPKGNITEPDIKRQGSLSPRKKKTTRIENSGKQQEHQKMITEALMLQGLTSNNQENLAKLSYNELMNQFDKMKSYEIYFPYNNVEVIVEIAKRNSALKRRRTKFKKGSNVSPHDLFQQNFSSFYQQMSFKNIFKKETLNTHNSNYNYEDLMYRRAITQNDGSPAKRLRLLPSKSITYNKGITTIKQNIHLQRVGTIKKKISKFKFQWICQCCFKKGK